MLTTAGRDFVAAQIGGTATTATAQYMAITTDAAAASAADTTLASEETTNGLDVHDHATVHLLRVLVEGDREGRAVHSR